MTSKVVGHAKEEMSWLAIGNIELQHMYVHSEEEHNHGMQLAKETCGHMNKYTISCARTSFRPETAVRAWLVNSAS